MQAGSVLYTFAHVVFNKYSLKKQGGIMPEENEKVKTRKAVNNVDMILHRAFEKKEILIENGSVSFAKNISPATQRAVGILSGRKFDAEFLPEHGRLVKRILDERRRGKAQTNINSLYSQLGAYSSRLGLALSDMKAKDDGGYLMEFRGGKIETDVNGNAWAESKLRVELWLVGLQCVLKQEVEDEVYGSITALMPSFGGSFTHTFPNSGDTFKFRHDGERIVNLAVKLYDGPPADLAITGNLKEKDSTVEISQYKKKVEEWASKAVAAFGGALGPGAEAMASDQSFIKDITNILFDLVGNILGLNDDVYTPQTMSIFANDIISENYGHHTRTSKSRSVNFTHAFDVSGFDEGGDEGIYTFFTDLRVFGEQDRL